ncbi:MAG: hypothetical protein PUC39_10045 [Lachnospiraceae bacterium]|nr:hypothetical protein [Lachnospiraceae bacterium]
MGFASSRMSLMEIQDYLAEHLREVHVICDLELSEEDYRYLSTKVKMLFQFANDNNIVDDYKLSIVVYWVFSMVYWDKQNLGRLEMEQLFEGLPQYKKKYYLDVCMEAFDEYGIYKYPVNYNIPILQAKAIIARHAGVPREEQEEVFSVISRYLECNLVADMVEAVMMELPERTQTIFCCFDDQTKQKVILDIRNLMITCIKGVESKKHFFEQHPYIARNLLEGVLRWCDQQQKLLSMLS